MKITSRSTPGLDLGRKRVVWNLDIYKSETGPSEEGEGMMMIQNHRRERETGGRGRARDHILPASSTKSRPASGSPHPHGLPAHWQCPVPSAQCPVTGCSSLPPARFRIDQRRPKAWSTVCPTRFAPRPMLSAPMRVGPIASPALATTTRRACWLTDPVTP